MRQRWPDLGDPMKQPFPAKITIGEKYGPAMAITDQAAADEYFERCVQHTMARGPYTRETAETLERSNLGYYAGYCDEETRGRVERLFKCEHPVLGPVSQRKSVEEILQLGREMAQKMTPRGGT